MTLKERLMLAIAFSLMVNVVVNLALAAAGYPFVRACLIQFDIH